MERLEPIPSPPGHLFREFCHRALPVVVFAAAGLTATLLWNQRFTGTTLFGEVEPHRVNIATLQDGTVTRLHVERFQSVTNGQIIATLETLDSESAHRSLEVLRSELEVMRARMGLDEARNDQNVESIRIRSLEARVELATAKVALENASRDLQRAARLHADKIMSDADFDAATTLQEALEVEVRERTQLAEGLQEAVRRLDATNQRDRKGSIEILNESLAAQERQIESTRDIHLRSPADGIIKDLAVNEGERVSAGTIVAVVTSPHAQRIIGFVRQPITLRPQPGMTVQVRTRGLTPQVRESRITGVGVDLELVNSPLRLRGFDNATERGLPFFVELPADLDVFPGELVDLVVRPPR